MNMINEDEGEGSEDFTNIQKKSLKVNQNTNKAKYDKL